MRKLAWLAALIVTLAIWAQDTTGRAVGTVTDPTGAVVPDVKIVVTNVNTGVTRETTTTSD
ncbi:MAG: hypothetical protein AAB225_19625, partial [Acidobacteriota bacterium]